MSVRWWCFHEEQLAAALTAFEARRIGDIGLHEPRDWLTHGFKSDTKLIAQFLTSPEAKKLLGDEQ